MHSRWLPGQRPAQWWGSVWDAPVHHDLPMLVRTGLMSPPVAGLLAACARRQASLAVVAVPSGAGKTTLLSALLDLDETPRRQVYLRGSWETFAFLEDPDIAPGNAILLVNEISSHLPHYLWGPAVERLLQLGREGFRIAATAHAHDARAFVAMLAAPPLRIRPTLAAAFDIVVSLEARRDQQGIRRRVSGVWALAPGQRDAAVILPLADGDDTLEALDFRLDAIRDLENAVLHGLTIAEVERVMQEPGVLVSAPPPFAPYPLSQDS